MATVTPGSAALFQDGVYSVKEGPVYDGTDPTAALASADTVLFKCMLENLRYAETSQRTRVSNCNTPKYRTHSPEQMVTADVMVPTGGILFERGKVYQLSLDTFSSVHLASAVNAVCTEAITIFEGPGGATKQQVTLDLNMDFSL